MKKLTKCFMALFAMLGVCIPTYASEASLVVPNIKESPFDYNLLLVGIVIALLGVVFGLIEFLKIKKIQVHPIMESVGNTIFETCKTYLVQQGKFLIILEVIIGICIAYYFGVLENMGAKGVGLILLWSVIGILGSYFVAWFGIRMNTLANA